LRKGEGRPSIDVLPTMSDHDLLEMRAWLDAELRGRGIATVGAVGERLAVEHFVATAGLPNLQPARTGTKNVDALSRNGDRFSIKTVCRGKKTGTVYPDPVDRDKQLFEYLLIVRLTESWSLDSINQLSWIDFQEVRSWDSRMNAWYVAISDRVFDATTLVFSATHCVGEP